MGSLLCLPLTLVVLPGGTSAHGVLGTVVFPVNIKRQNPCPYLLCWGGTEQICGATRVGIF